MRNYKRDSKGRFARNMANRSAAKAKYNAAKKKNAAAHRARVKGSVKARGKEILTTAPRRSKNLVGGTAIYAAGRYMGSTKAQSVGLSMGKAGLRGGVGRVGATRAMSKGLMKSQNRKAQDEYYKSIGTSRAKRNAMKIAGAAVVAGAGLYAVKNGHLGVQGGVADHLKSGSIGVRIGKNANFTAGGSYIVGSKSVLSHTYMSTKGKTRARYSSVNFRR